jgi:hypothetical protein
VPTSTGRRSVASNIVPNNYRDSIGDDEYVARVRRYAPSSLVPLVASAAAQYAAPGSWQKSPWMKFTPWALADIARVSLISGNEFKSAASADDLLRCCAAYVAVNDPELAANTPGSLAGFMLRITSEQLSYEQSPFHLIGRAAALFKQTQPAPGKVLKVLQPGWDTELLGCTLSQYVGTGFIVHVAATKNSGLFLADWLDRPELASLTTALPPELMTTITERNFVGTVDWFKSQRAKPLSGSYRRFSFNPLLAKPVVAGIVAEYLIPVPAQLFRKVSPLGLYYSGVSQWGNAFAEDVGELFEQYVGRQLGQVSDATVYAEITYGKDNNRSVDWIVVCQDAVILVEVKSVRPTDAIRLGKPHALDEFRRMLGHAFKQLDTANELIANQHPQFSHIPADLPRVGLVVTMEPFEIANVKPLLDFQEVEPPIPTNVCASIDLELLVTLQDKGIGTFLIELLTDQTKLGYRISTALKDHTLGRNSVLDQAWASYEWAPLNWTDQTDGQDTAAEN